MSSLSACGKLPSVAILMGDNGLGAPNSGSRELPDLLDCDPLEPVPSSATVITQTFSLVSQAGGKAVAYFYGRLFAENPQLRALFPAAMDSQRDRLFGALTKIVHSLGQPEVMEPYLARLGQDHRKYGVRAEHYPAVGQRPAGHTAPVCRAGLDPGGRVGLGGRLRTRRAADDGRRRAGGGTGTRVVVG